MAKKAVIPQIVFYTYPPLLFAWPLILVGFLLYPLVGWGVLGTEVAGWVYVATLVLVTLTMGVDLNREKTVIWVLIVGVLAALCWVAALKDFPVASHIVRFLAGFQPQYSVGLGLGVSLFLSVAYLLMLVWSRVNDKWVFSHNEFEHISFGRTDESLARGAKTVRSEYLDFLELFVCLAGTLHIYDATGQRCLKTIPHVPFLPFLRRRIDRFMERTAVVGHGILEEEGDGGEDNQEKSV